MADKPESQIEESLRRMYELGFKHGRDQMKIELEIEQLQAQIAAQQEG